MLPLCEPPAEEELPVEEPELVDPPVLVELPVELEPPVVPVVVVPVPVAGVVPAAGSTGPVGDLQPEPPPVSAMTPQFCGPVCTGAFGSRTPPFGRSFVAGVRTEPSGLRTEPSGIRIEPSVNLIEPSGWTSPFTVPSWFRTVPSLRVTVPSAFSTAPAGSEPSVLSRDGPRLALARNEPSFGFWTVPLGRSMSVRGVLPSGPTIVPSFFVIEPSGLILSGGVTVVTDFVVPSAPRTSTRLPLITTAVPS